MRAARRRAFPGGSTLQAGTVGESALSEQPETIEVTMERVACDGGGGPLGHPKVFLTLGADGRAVCGYCGRVFVKKAAPKPAPAAASDGS